MGLAIKPGMRKTGFLAVTVAKKRKGSMDFKLSILTGVGCDEKMTEIESAVSI
jgi:hypothetical protein